MPLPYQLGGLDSLSMLMPSSQQGGMSNQFPTAGDMGYDYKNDYDYEAARAAGVIPENGHFDSRFKKDWHERRFLPSPVGIFDTKYSRIIPPIDFHLQATPVQKNFIATTKESLSLPDVLRFSNSNK